MKKAILFAALALGTCAAQAQITDAGAHFTDNWSFTLKGGGVFATNTATGEDFLKTGRGIVGAEIKKQITPSFGLGFEGEWTVNTSSWGGYRTANAFDNSYVGMFGAVNLMNLFAGYAGQPRVFEIEAVAGAGWLHGYVPHTSYYNGGNDTNSFGTKVGLNLNFNLGSAKAWTFSLKPALVWNMNGQVTEEFVNPLGYESHYNVDHMYFELQAGLTYHFVNANGTHSFAIQDLYDAVEVGELNGEINALRGDIEKAGQDNNALLDRIKDLEAQLDACRREPKVQQVIKNLDATRYVFFNCGSATVQANQMPEIALTAKAADGGKINVTGYASKDGSLAFNEKLAARRADAVKKILVNQYGVAEGNVNAKGAGIGDLFTENDWNRVAVLTVE